MIPYDICPRAPCFLFRTECTKQRLFAAAHSFVLPTPYTLVLRDKRFEETVGYYLQDEIVLRTYTHDFACKSESLTFFISLFGLITKLLRLAWTWKATFGGIRSHLHSLGRVQRVVASAVPRRKVLCIVTTYTKLRGKRTVEAQPPATDPQRRAQAGGSLRLPSRVRRSELGSPENERTTHGRA